MSSFPARGNVPSSSARVAVLLSIALLCAAAGCTTSDERQGANTESELAAGQFDIAIAFPSGLDETNVALHGSRDVDIGPNVVLRTLTDGRPASVSLGDGLLQVGDRSKTGTLVSGGAIRVGRLGSVEGDAQATGAITLEPGAVVTGEQRPNTPLGALSTLALRVDFPRTTNAVRLRDHQVRTLEPGAFTAVEASGRSVVMLRAGTFYVDDLHIRGGATLKLDAGEAPIILFVRRALTIDGTMDVTAGRLLIGYLGAAPVSLRSSFRGTLVAPNASLTLARTPHPSHHGAFLAKRIDAGHGAQHSASHRRGHGHFPPAVITHVPFGHWDRIVPPKVFVNCVARVAPERYVALFGYSNALATEITIPHGPENQITPAVAAANVAPPETLSPGSHPVAFWVPIDGDSVTWTVRASRATATPSSPSCGPDAWPIPPGTDVALRGESPSDPSPLAHRSAPYFTGDQPATKTELSSLTAPLALGPPSHFLPFVVRFTSLRVGGDRLCGLAMNDLFAQVTIDGQAAGARNIYEALCLPGSGEPNFGATLSLSESFSAQVSVSQQLVDVRIRLIDISGNIFDETFSLDNQAGQPEQCVNANEWRLCFEIQHTGVPPNIPEPRVCATWNADFIDGQRGEDDEGTAVAGTTYRQYPASFASFQLGVAGPLAPFSVATGFLDQDGCVPVGAIPKEAFVFEAGAEPEFPGGPNSGGLQLLFSVDASRILRSDGVEYQLSSVVHGSPSSSLFPTFYEISTGSAQTVQHVHLETWQSAGGWRIPPARIDLTSAQLSPATSAAAAISALLSRPDTGIVPGIYPVFQGTGDEFTDTSGRKYVESNGGDVLNIGLPRPLPVSVPCTVDDDCSGAQQCLLAGPFDSRPCDAAGGGTCECKWPDQARWKYTVAHEAGHQVQHFGLGELPITLYTFACPPGMTCVGLPSEDPRRPGLVDPPRIVSDAPLCGCQHVTAANRLHCLQSIETSASAQVEGFGQFFASRVWNRQAEPDCTFVYYKDVLDRTRLTPDAVAFMAPGGQALFTHPPPFTVDCLGPFKWRNRECPMGPEAEMGTELDWMAFFYNLNSGGDAALLSPMSDIFRIYKHACVPPPPAGTPPPADPPLCASNYSVGWTSLPPSLPLVSIRSMSAVSIPCTTDADCSTLTAPVDPDTLRPIRHTCRDDQPADSVLPCTDGTCRCKLTISCTADAECIALNGDARCRDATAASPLACPTGGPCVCKIARSCTPDVGCPRFFDVPDQRCRDDSMGFAPCTDGSCVCARYERFGFENGASLAYAGDPSRLARVRQFGFDFGVNNDLSP